MYCSWKKPKGTKLKYTNRSVSNRPNDNTALRSKDFLIEGVFFFRLLCWFQNQHKSLKKKTPSIKKSLLLRAVLSLGLLLTDLFVYFNFVPFGFFQLQYIDYLWIHRKTLVDRSLYKEFIKGTTRVEKNYFVNAITYKCS